MNAFQAAGITSKHEQFGDSIRRAIRWIISNQREDGLVAHGSSAEASEMYHHGIAMLTLAKAYPHLRDPLRSEVNHVLVRGVQLTLRAQEVAKQLPRHIGGWRYRPDSNDSDISITVWQVRSLRAAQKIGIPVAEERFNRAAKFLRGLQTSYKSFGYKSPIGGMPGRSMAAIVGLAACGESNTTVTQNAIRRFESVPLRMDDKYFFYNAHYCCLAIGFGNKRFAEYTERVVCDRLLALQNRRGTWLAASASEKRFGEAYATSFAVVSLCALLNHMAKVK